MTAALVTNGSESTSAIVVFVEAQNGDLVDEVYYCLEHDPFDADGKALWWPDYSWPADYDVFCATCFRALNTHSET